MKTKLKKLIIHTVLASVVFFPNIVLAQGLKTAPSLIDSISKKLGYKSVAEGGDIGTIIGSVISTVLTLVGMIFLVLMVYAGYLWMTARGEDTQVNKAKDIVKGTIIGLILVMSAYAITFFVTSGINQ